MFLAKKNMDIVSLSQNPEFNCIDFNREYSFDNICEIYSAEKISVPEIGTISDFINSLIRRGELIQVKNKFYFSKI